MGFGKRVKAPSSETSSAPTSPSSSSSSVDVVAARRTVISQYQSVQPPEIFSNFSAPLISSLRLRPCRTDFSANIRKGCKMIVSILIRGLMMAFGYVYPAYECYKAIEKNKPEIEQLRFWCQYWILVAILTVFEKFGDAFVSWIPMYSEAKLVFIIYLWYPKTKGAAYVYDAFFRPYVAKHENYIDCNLSELKTRASDVTVFTWQRALSYGQTRVFEILQYIASQSATPPRVPQQQQPASPSVPAPNRQEPVTSQPQNAEPSSPMSSTSLSHDQKDGAETLGPEHVPNVAPPLPTPSNSRMGASSQNSSHSGPTEVEAAMSEELLPMDYEIIDSPPTEIMMEDTETLSSLRRRLRMGRSAPDQ